MNKALISNFIAGLLIVLSFVLEAPFQNHLLSAGLFALSGGVTNWLAIYMLFERVPGIYGSGVIPLRFEEFKAAIRDLIISQFFNKENLHNFIDDLDATNEKVEQQLKKAAAKLDIESAFDALLDVIMASSFGSMLGMLGGRDAMNPLKDPFVEKMREFLATMFEKESFKEQLQEAMNSAIDSDRVQSRLQELIDTRLDQMTPQMVKEIIQNMIRQHLGWLVVWGCVFGGLIGLLVSLLTN